MPVFSALGIGAAAASLSGHANDSEGSASDALHDASGAVGSHPMIGLHYCRRTSYETGQYL